MIIEDRAEDVEVVGNDEKTSHEFEIDKDALGVFFRGFSDSLYSDKIGSIVREVASNCLDSHAEAGTTDPIQIRLLESDDFDDDTSPNGGIIFEDFGVGLSPDRIKNIYSKYFASTKRGTNDQIGGFGIGAKSPFAYTPSFFVTTFHDGTQYNYLLHRGTGTPKIELVHTEPTTNRNGTQVRIDFLKYNDNRLFESAILEQLKYFDNVSVLGFNEWDNEYKIVKANKWIFNTSAKTSRLELCIGNVRYPLNHDLISREVEHIYFSYGAKSNIALHFDVGEIPVTMNRESVEYTPAAVKLIGERFLEVKASLEELQRKNSFTETIHDYVQEDRSPSGFANLVVGEETYKIRESTMLDTKTPIFRGLMDDFDITRQGARELIPFIFVYEFLGFGKTLGKYNRGGMKGQNLFFKDNQKKYHYTMIRLKPDSRVSAMKREYIKDTYERAILIKMDTEPLMSAIEEGDIKAKDPAYDIINTSKLYIKALLPEIVANTISIDDVIVPAEYETEYNEIKSAERARYKTHKVEGNFSVRLAYIPGRNYYSPKPVYKILDTNGVQFRREVGNRITIYGNSIDSEKLLNVYEHLFRLPSTGKEQASFGGRTDNYEDRTLNRFRVVKVAMTLNKYMESLPHTYHIDDIAVKLHHLFYRLYVRAVISNYRNAQFYGKEIFLNKLPYQQEGINTFKFNGLEILRTSTSIANTEWEEGKVIDFNSQEAMLYIPSIQKHVRLEAWLEDFKTYMDSHKLFTYLTNERELPSLAEDSKEYIDKINYKSKLKLYV